MTEVPPVLAGVCEPAWTRVHPAKPRRKTDNVLRDLADWNKPMQLTRALRADIIKHALLEMPRESCGVLVAPAGQTEPTEYIRMVNAAADPTRFYEFDPEHFKGLFHYLDNIKMHDVVALVHSHTATEAYPSQVDIGGAIPTVLHYLIASTCTTGEVDLKAYRIEGGEVTEAELHIA